MDKVGVKLPDSIKSNLNDRNITSTTTSGNNTATSMRSRNDVHS